ncbi:hypothetical protein BJ170DRAFT_681329 [Xylariales sp. AK1849]|nr:hypothetical protein BJ170DRAFT_681329 [Xylariales sp. AK1849]
MAFQVLTSGAIYGVGPQVTQYGLPRVTMIAAEYLTNHFPALSYIINTTIATTIVQIQPTVPNPGDEPTSTIQIDIVGTTDLLDPIEGDKTTPHPSVGPPATLFDLGVTDAPALTNATNISSSDGVTQDSERVVRLETISPSVRKTMITAEPFATLVNYESDEELCDSTGYRMMIDTVGPSPHCQNITGASSGPGLLPSNEHMRDGERVVTLETVSPSSRHQQTTASATRLATPPSIRDTTTDPVPEGWTCGRILDATTNLVICSVDPQPTGPPTWIGDPITTDTVAAVSRYMTTKTIATAAITTQTSRLPLSASENTSAQQYDSTKAVHFSTAMSVCNEIKATSKPWGERPGTTVDNPSPTWYTEDIKTPVDETTTNAKENVEIRTYGRRASESGITNSPMPAATSY